MRDVQTLRAAAHAPVPDGDDPASQLLELGEAFERRAAQPLQLVFPKSVPRRAERDDGVGSIREDQPVVLFMTCCERGKFDDDGTSQQHGCVGRRIARCCADGHAHGVGRRTDHRAHRGHVARNPICDNAERSTSETRELRQRSLVGHDERTLFTERERVELSRDARQLAWTAQHQRGPAQGRITDRGERAIDVSSPSVSPSDNAFEVAMQPAQPWALNDQRHATDSYVSARNELERQATLAVYAQCFSARL